MVRSRVPAPLGRLIDWAFLGAAGPGLVALCGLAAFGTVLATATLFADGDTFWHLAAGEWILRHGAVPTTDPFSYTFAGAPWNAHEWLAELVMSLAFRAAGWSGLAVLFAAAFGATAVVLAAYLRRWLAPAPLLLAAGLALACSLPSLLARPHLLALPLLAAWFAGLICAREERRAPSWTLVPLMLAWANLHGSFVFGLALIAPFALEALIEDRKRPWPVVRDWGLFALAALAMALVNPHGLEGLIFPLKLTSMNSLPIIREWRSSDFGRPSAFEAALLGAVFLCLWRGVKIPVLRLVLLLALMHMALQHMRHQAVFALAGAMLLAQPLSRTGTGTPLIPKRRVGGWPGSAAATAAACVALVAAAGWRLSVPIVRTDAVNAPISALAAVAPGLAGQPVFNEYAFGGYLIFKGVRPFIDGRADMYGDRFMHIYAGMARPDLAVLRPELEGRRIAWTILSARNPAVAVLDAMPGWRRLYADKFAVVHVRREAADAQGRARRAP